MRSFFSRLREPSTWAGLAAIAVGVGQVGDINEAAQVADALTSVGPILGAGLAAIFLSEGGR